MEKKLTKKEKFEMVKGYIQDNEMLIEFIDHEIELLNKKSSASGQTKTQKENEVIKEKIVLALTEINRPVSITELQSINEEMSLYSNQKLSALLKQMVDAGTVKKNIDKKKSYFELVN